MWGWEVLLVRKVKLKCNENKPLVKNFKKSEYLIYFSNVKRMQTMGGGTQVKFFTSQGKKQRLWR